jgi:hypothetical protein
MAGEKNHSSEKSRVAQRRRFQEISWRNGGGERSD